MSADAASDRLVFDSTGLSVADAFARYDELYGHGAEVIRTGPRFRANVEAWRLERMLLYDRRLNDVGHHRDARRTNVTGFTHFTATLLLDGDLEMVDADGTVRRPAPGEVVLADMQVAGRNQMRNAHLVTLSLARERMAAIASDVDRLHGLVLTADQARLFREFIESLLRNLPTMNRTATTAAAGVLTTLLMVAIENSGGGTANVASLRDIGRLDRLKRLIDARLVDPEFGAAEAIRESGLSRATLYRLAVAEGGIATLIRNRRLENIRARLSDLSDRRSITEIVDASGFASVSHASHAFVERFTIRPREYRDIIGAKSGADAYLKMRFWQEEVR